MIDTSYLFYNELTTWSVILFMVSLVMIVLMTVILIVNLILRKPKKQIKTIRKSILGFVLLTILFFGTTVFLDGKTEEAFYEEMEKADEFKEEMSHVFDDLENESATIPSELIEILETEPVDTKPIEEIDYATIYREYKANELRADEKYKNNRYRITAKINGMATGGLLNMTGGATLTMEIRVDNTIVFFYAEFEKEQENALKSVSVGDTISFEGECLSASVWTNCELGG